MNVAERFQAAFESGLRDENGFYDLSPAKVLLGFSFKLGADPDSNSADPSLVAVFSDGSVALVANPNQEVFPGSVSVVDPENVKYHVTRS